MTQARLMDGTALARRIVEDTARRAAELTARTGVVPCLATVLVGEDPASVTYVRMKQNRCRKAGITSRHVALPASTSTAELVGTLRELSADPTVHGILLQHPVGDHVDERAAFEAIAPEKDVDGVTFASFATMSFGLPGFVSCTPGGILRLLDEYGVELAGKRAVVVGRSAILGKPVGMLLLARDATVTYCHSRTRDLSAAVREADIVVAAVGRPRLLRGQDIKPGAVVIDAGYNAGNVGDVDFDSAVERASLITPVPGGVGPMTIATLLEQTVTAAEAAAGGLAAA
ncbi:MULTISPECIES: bifunctional 5,10-methylenetetrahydrofolate dehydrogenase/5,10-methenyltetrahydrofolate cyclohydrolase [Actinomycetes]|uniref:Bifunctional protein FolD n=2 Tax=Actinomycetes TaxID=1760 RepID=A0ABN3L3G3_9ACTN|nr:MULTISPECIES: bifunctional 5,10-methylenetetrahydrofolate dehydrogenase/5,10-methenyltetrahydrofolate cyclohydrolase [unclassified Streptomyces]MCE3030351.1 bifunctional 5,10-methylenetetrahydrofolate dehydrogenase/5,10-methenyltetrahydrofolate cyclohydrolase [Streptomyces sp. CMSTAAHL-2]TGZ14594.1 bifunctional protein FolD [Streptomyces sp. S816]